MRLDAASFSPPTRSSLRFLEAASSADVDHVPFHSAYKYGLPFFQVASVSSHIYISPTLNNSFSPTLNNSFNARSIYSLKKQDQAPRGSRYDPFTTCIRRPFSPSKASQDVDG